MRISNTVPDLLIGCTLFPEDVAPDDYGLGFEVPAQIAPVASGLDDPPEVLLPASGLDDPPEVLLPASGLDDPPSIDDVGSGLDAPVVLDPKDPNAIDKVKSGL